ncbi:MAG: hypothetical protein R3C49_18750 [Planctomycetaceae bacterium]
MAVVSSGRFDGGFFRKHKVLIRVTGISQENALNFRERKTRARWLDFFVLTSLRAKPPAGMLPDFGTH